MYIKKIEINAFGCFTDKEFELNEKFNLIYGLNESGKSTLFAFVVFMFYGTKMKKEALSFKERYMPWNGAPMQGRITFEHEGDTYVLDRLSTGTKSTEKLYCVNRGEEIKDRAILASPGEYFFGVGAQAFYSSAFYQGSKNSPIPASSDEIITKLTQADENSTAEVSYNEILETINDEILNLTSARRKTARIPILQNELKAKNEEIRLAERQIAEVTHITQQNTKLTEQISAIEDSISKLQSKNEVLAESPNGEHKRQNYDFLLLGLSILLFALSAAFTKIWLLMPAIILLSLYIALTVKKASYAKGIKLEHDTKVFTIQENNDKIALLIKEAGELRAAVARNEGRLSVCRENCADIKDLIYEKAQIDLKLEACKKDVQALELARLALSNAYYEYKSVFAPRLSKLAGNILSKLTSGKYDTALVDDSLCMSVSGEFGFKDAIALSQGASYQAGLALHLALSEIVFQKSNVPIFLDDAFAFYDDDRVKSSAQYLTDLSEKKQIIFATCRKSELDYFSKDKVNLLYFNQTEGNDLNVS